MGLLGLNELDKLAQPKRKPIKKHGKPEWYIQKDCVKWLRSAHRDWLIFSVPNEATRTRSAYFAEIGMLAGVSDTIIVNRDGVYFIEFKAKDGRMRAEQLHFQSIVEGMGYKYFICRSLEQFKEIVAGL